MTQISQNNGILDPKTWYRRLSRNNWQKFEQQLLVVIHIKQASKGSPGQLTAKETEQLARSQTQGGGYRTSHHHFLQHHIIIDTRHSIFRQMRINKSTFSDNKCRYQSSIGTISH